MEHIYEIIGKLLAAAFVALLAYLTPRAKAWLEANVTRTTQERVQQLVQAFARAAEQLYRETDPSGEARNRFVREQLTALGVEVTEAVINMIEGAVWEINTENKKAQVQDKALTAGGNGNV